MADYMLLLFLLSVWYFMVAVFTYKLLWSVMLSSEKCQAEAMSVMAAKKVRVDRVFTILNLSIITVSAIWPYSLVKAALDKKFFLEVQNAFR